MKHMIKKISASFLAFTCVLGLTASGASAVFAADGIDDTTLSTLQTYTTSLVQAIVELTDEEIATYKEADDDFTVNTMNNWESVKDDVGEYKEMGDIEYETSDDGYTATVPVNFDKQDTNFVFTYDENLNPTDVSIDVQYSLGTQMKNAALNTVMGLGTVFVVLAILIFLISLFKYIPGSSAGKAKTETAKNTPAAASAPAASPAPAAADNSELVAVIAAAIAASEGTSTDSFVVRSIRKVKRPRY